MQGPGRWVDGEIEMAFKAFPEQEQAVRLLQRSLERGRLAHAYLFAGEDLDALEGIARMLVKTLGCLEPVRGAGGVAVDCCDQCLNCRKIDHGNHPDLHWVRPESKSRVITVEQMRGLMQEINLKTTEGGCKAALIVAADRLNAQAANAFLKTLEEPPPGSVLLTTEPQRILETILSRCMRLNFGGHRAAAGAIESGWLGGFSEVAAAEQKSLISRYRLLDVLLQQLNALKASTDESLTAQSPLQRNDDADPALRDKWEEELSAAIEAEYRRKRAELMAVLQRWFRDVWLHRLALQSAEPAALEALLEFPGLKGAREVAERVSAAQAMENVELLEGTQRLLHTNVQEALALEVGLLKLHL
jgi:DNA polymerase-3 subunit delta'